MRNYFGFSLKGAQICLYVLIGWAVSMAITICTSLPEIRVLFSGVVTPPEEALLDGEFVGRMLISLGTMFVQLVVNYGVAFYVVRATAGGLSLGEERFVPEYDFGRYMRMVVMGAFFCVVTFGIYFPWFLARVVRYFAANTSFRFNTLKFNGKGVTLFSIIVLTMILPLFFIIFSRVIIFAMATFDVDVLWLAIVMLVFLLIMSFFVVLTLKWFVDFSFGPKRITADIRLAPATFFVMGQIFMVMITVGFYGPMYMLRIYRYFISRLVLGDEIVEDKFGFTLNTWKDYFFVLGQALLTIITLGIYSAWAYARISTRLFTHTYVEVVEEQKLPMPTE